MNLEDLDTLEKISVRVDGFSEQDIAKMEQNHESWLASLEPEIADDFEIGRF